MKQKRYSEEQIIHALKQVQDGRPSFCDPLEETHDRLRGTAPIGK